MPRRYTIEENEGAFFYQPWLYDNVTHKSWRVDDLEDRKPPAPVLLEYLSELHKVGKLTPQDARFLLDFSEAYAKVLLTRDEIGV